MTVQRRVVRGFILAGLAALLRPEMTQATVHASTTPGLVFHTVNPCRVVDTRTAGGPLVAGGNDRTFTIVGPTCGIPAGARAVSLNLAVTQPTASGNVRLYPAGAAVPTVSAINYSAGQTRSNNAVVGLSAAGELKARAQPTGTVHLILDVNGYFVAGPSFLGCDSPAEGALVDVEPGAAVPITGTAVGLSDVRVNGTPVVVAGDDTFSASVTGRYGLNFVELSAIDGAGATRTALCAFLGAEHWAMEGARFDEALVFRMEQRGFNKLTSLVPSWINAHIEPDLHSALAANIGHAVIGNCGGFGTCADIEYLSVSATLHPLVNISVTNQNTLRVQAELGLRVRLRVSGKEVGAPRGPITGDAVFSNTNVSVDVSFTIDPVTGVPGVLRAQVNSAGLGAADWSQFTGLGTTVGNMVVSYVEPELGSSLGVVVLGDAAGLFEGLIAGMDITLPAAGFPVGRLDGTANMTVALTRWSGISLRNQGLTLLTGLRVTSPPPPPAATGRIPLPLFANTDLPGRGADAWSAVHVGVFNQVLQALWRAGLFDGTVDRAALGLDLPAGTSVSVQLRTMPVVTGFDPATTGLDVGALDLVVTHPSLPPGLGVTVGARMQASASLVSDDLVFGDIVASELRFSTGAVALDAASQATLEDLIRRLLAKLADIALNDSLPVLPATVFTFPTGSQLVVDPTLAIETNRVLLEGNIGSIDPW